MTNILPKVRQTGFVTQELKNEILIYNLTTHKAFCLNNSMAHIWSCCDGETTAQQVINSFKDKFQMKINEDFVWLAIDDLAKADLIEAHSTKFKDRISRRKAILQFALPLAMLPVITTIVAPIAANAASGVCTSGTPGYCVNDVDCSPPGATCNLSINCCSGASGGGGQSGAGDPCQINCG